MEEALTEAQLGDLADYIEPNNQERIAQILHPGEGSMMMAFLRAEHRENVWGVGDDILQRWLVKNHHPGNRLVSIHGLRWSQGVVTDIFSESKLRLLNL